MKLFESFALYISLAGQIVPFEEWKPEEKLLELMVTHPGRYQRDESGKWRCPPGEAAAESLGISALEYEWNEIPR